MSPKSALLFTPSICEHTVSDPNKCCGGKANTSWMCLLLCPSTKDTLGKCHVLPIEDLLCRAPCWVQSFHLQHMQKSGICWNEPENWCDLAKQFSLSKSLSCKNLQPSWLTVVSHRVDSQAAGKEKSSLPMHWEFLHSAGMSFHYLFGGVEQDR